MATRDRLVEATQELLWERGYVGTSPSAIQERAGAGQGSMYHHFAGKPDLARAAIERSAEALRERAAASLDGEGPALPRIAAWLRRRREPLRGCPVGRLAHDPEVVATPALRRPLDETFAWLRGRLAALVTQAIREGQVDPALDPAATAAALLAVVQGGYALARAAGADEPFHAAVEGALALLSPPVRPAP